MSWKSVSLPRQGEPAGDYDYEDNERFRGPSSLSQRRKRLPPETIHARVCRTPAALSDVTRPRRGKHPIVRRELELRDSLKDCATLEVWPDWLRIN